MYLHIAIFHKVVVNQPLKNLPNALKSSVFEARLIDFRSTKKHYFNEDLHRSTSCLRR